MSEAVPKGFESSDTQTQLTYLVLLFGICIPLLFHWYYLNSVEFKYAETQQIAAYKTVQWTEDSSWTMQ